MTPAPAPVVRMKCSCGGECEGNETWVERWWSNHREWCSWAAEFVRWRDKAKLTELEKRAAARKRDED